MDHLTQFPSQTRPSCYCHVTDWVPDFWVPTQESHSIIKKLPQEYVSSLFLLKTP